MTPEYGFLLFIIGMTVTVTGFYVALSIATKQLEKEKEEKIKKETKSILDHFNK